MLLKVSVPKTALKNESTLNSSLILFVKNERTVTVYSCIQTKMLQLRESSICEKLRYSNTRAKVTSLLHICYINELACSIYVHRHTSRLASIDKFSSSSPRIHHNNEQLFESRENNLMSLALLFLYLMLNMFRMLIHPSSGACDLCVELFQGLH